MQHDVCNIYGISFFFRNESNHAAETSTGKLNLSAWEHWLVSKAKEERIKMHEKSLQVNSVKFFVVV